MTIAAKDVMDLRRRTGAGMMDCKKALAETGGDMDAAIAHLRTKGLAAAAKKAHRAASQGLVVVAGGPTKSALVELNCETDFVARNDEFRSFADELANQALAAPAGTDADALSQQPFTGQPEHTVAESISQKVASIGENIVLSTVEVLEASDDTHLASYVHAGGVIGVVVEGDEAIPEDALRDVAMHVAAADPRFASRDEVTQADLDSERDIAKRQAMEQGKPEHIADKIVTGKMEKFFETVVLPEQPFAKDSSTTVGEYVRERAGGDARVRRFVRVRVGESG